MKTETQTQTKQINELQDRIIGKYVCMISRNHDGIDERTYEIINGELSFVQGGLNHIPQNHPRYKELSDELDMEGM